MKWQFTGLGGELRSHRALAFMESAEPRDIEPASVDLVDPAEQFGDVVERMEKTSAEGICMAERERDRETHEQVGIEAVAGPGLGKPSAPIG